MRIACIPHADIGGTLQHKWLDPDKSCQSPGPRHAIEQCLARNYTIAINTYAAARSRIQAARLQASRHEHDCRYQAPSDAEPNKAAMLALGIPKSTVDNDHLWRTRVVDNQTLDKIVNMDEIANFTGVLVKLCVVLFDDETINIDAVRSAGFALVFALAPLLARACCELT